MCISTIFKNLTPKPLPTEKAIREGFLNDGLFVRNHMKKHYMIISKN